MNVNSLKKYPKNRLLKIISDLVDRINADAAAKEESRLHLYAVMRIAIRENLGEEALEKVVSNIPELTGKSPKALREVQRIKFEDLHQ